MEEVYCKNCHHSERDHLNPGRGKKYLPCRGEKTIDGKVWPPQSEECQCEEFEPGKVIARVTAS
jgi:hypothetical protein